MHLQQKRNKHYCRFIGIFGMIQLNIHFLMNNKFKFFFYASLLKQFILNIQHLNIYQFKDEIIIQIIRIQFFLIT
ncbi:hypothetical protein pb186bvf_009384 [Paramecium bursaria]